MNLEIQYIRQGDQQVFRRVFERHYPELVEYAYRFLFEKSAAEDLVQEIFIDIWQSRQDLKIRKSLRAYLFRVVRNRCLNELKKLQLTDSQYYLDLSITLLADEKIDLEEEEEGALQERARAILEELPERMRLIFKLKAIEGLTYLEIAKELDISVNTVKTQLKRAQEKILEERKSIKVWLVVFDK